MAVEVWVRPNRRPAFVLFCASAVLAIFAVAVVVLNSPWNTAGRQLLAGTALGAALVAVMAGVAALLRATRPRIFRRGRHVCFHLGQRGPSCVPLDVVEAFFLGKGPAHLPGRVGERLESVNLVARLSQRATEWHRREIHPRLGQWCDGYITFRGTCCEPLDTETVHRLNRLLSAAKQETAQRG